MKNKLDIQRRFNNFLMPFYEGMWMGLYFGIISVILFILMYTFSSNLRKSVVLSIVLSLIFGLFIFIIFSLKGIYESCINYYKYKREWNNGTYLKKLKTEFICNPHIELYLLVVYKYHEIINDDEFKFKLQQFEDGDYIKPYDLIMIFQIVMLEENHSIDEFNFIVYAKSILNVTRDVFLIKKKQFLMSRDKVDSSILKHMFNEGIIDEEEYHQKENTK